MEDRRTDTEVSTSQLLCYPVPWQMGGNSQMLTSISTCNAGLSMIPFSRIISEKTWKSLSPFHARQANINFFKRMNEWIAGWINFVDIRILQTPASSIF